MSLVSIVPIEEERFGAYVHRPECPGSIVHPPVGDTSSLVATTTPFPPILLSYIIQLPYRWKDERRIREAAMYIAYIALRHWQRTTLSQVANLVDMGRTESATLLQIADRLIAPRPWVEQMARQFGTSRSALMRAAQSISIPWTSMRSVLHAGPLQEADAVHRHLRETTGYPWFLPAALRDRYPKDRW